MVASEEGEMRSYVTGRDCDDRQLLCSGCAAMAFSPSGRLVAAIEPTGELARVHDEILVIDLEIPGYEVLRRGFQGALPSWVDDERLLFLAAPEVWAGACDEEPPPPGPELVNLVVGALETGEERIVATGLRRGWTTCCPVVSADLRRVAIAENLANNCSDDFHVVSSVSLETGAPARLSWTDDLGRDVLDSPIGLLPDGSGFLVQTRTGWDPDRSTLYATTFDGLATSVAGPLATTSYVELPGNRAKGIWAHCTTVRRIGPACEVYCLDDEAHEWTRYDLVADTREPVGCAVMGTDFRIMDVRQVPADRS